MDARAIVDTGFLVALLNRKDLHYSWAKGLLPDLRGPWVTAEACISETVFLVEPLGAKAVRTLFSWLDRGLLQSGHFLPEEMEAVRAEMLRYHSRWVDFADACLVVQSDRKPRLPLVTVDTNDFSVYFRQRRGRRLLTP